MVPAVSDNVNNDNDNDNDNRGNITNDRQKVVLLRCLLDKGTNKEKTIVVVY